MENNERLEKIMFEIEKDPTRIISTLNNEIMRGEMEIESLNKEKEASKKLIIESGDEEVIALLNKIDNDNIPPEEIENELVEMKNKILGELKSLIEDNEDIINTITQ